MRAGLNRRILLAIVGAVLGLLVVAGSALAGRNAAADFAPFSMTKVEWRADLSSSGAGTITYRLEYRSRDSWTLTLVSHEANPAAAGTNWTYESGRLTHYDAWRNVTQVEQRPYSLDRWLDPTMLAGLTNMGGWARTDNIFTGQSTLSRTIRDGGTATEELLTFDTRSGLPVSIETRVNGTTTSRTTYTLVR